MSKMPLRQKIDATIEYMRNHLHEKITREQLARLARLNPEHYSRAFRRCTGRTPVAYLTELRVERARHLLGRSPLAVKEIARQVGFDDPYYFSRVFKRMTGCAPSDIQRRGIPRVIALDYYGHLRALGVEPVAVDASVDGMQGCLSDWPQYTHHIGPADGADREAERIVGQWQPEWIVSSKYADIERLSALCDVFVPDETADPIYGQLTGIARTLGREAEARAWISDYERRLARLRAVAAEYFRDDTVAVLRVRASIVQIYGNMIMGYPLYESLQVKPPAKLARQFAVNARYHSTVIDPDELRYYEADHLFAVVQPDAESRALWERIRRSAVWETFPAAARGNVYELDVHRWLAYDPVSIIRQAEEAAELASGRPHNAHNNPS